MQNDDGWLVVQYYEASIVLHGTKCHGTKGLSKEVSHSKHVLCLSPPPQLHLHQAADSSQRKLNSIGEEPSVSGVHYAWVG